MAVKIVNIEGAGDVKLTRRRGTRNIRLRSTSSGEIVISIPTWISFKRGENFAKQHVEWINKHRSAPSYLLPNRRIGKVHILLFKVTKSTKSTVQVNDHSVIVSVPIGMTVKSASVQASAIRGAKKALKAQTHLLEGRLVALSKSLELPYSSSRYAFMKSRWGSCRSNKTITLNYHLLDLPDEQIDYVICHELAHTVHLNHSKEFWELMSKICPDYINLRKIVKNIRFVW